MNKMRDNFCEQMKHLFDHHRDTTEGIPLLQIHAEKPRASYPRIVLYYDKYAWAKYQRRPSPVKPMLP